MRARVGAMADTHSDVTESAGDVDAHFAPVEPRHARARAWLLALIALLFIGSIPWYRESGSDPGLLLGLPRWTAIALLCYVAIAVLNAIAWLLTDVPDAPPDGDSERRVS